MINIQYDIKTGLATVTMDADDAVVVLRGIATLPAGALTDLINRAVARIASTATGWIPPLTWPAKSPEAAP